MNLRYMLAFMSILKIPSLMPVMKDLQAYLRFNFMFAAYESGLLAALSKPRSRDELIEILRKYGFARVEPEVFVPASTFKGLVAYT